MQLDAQIIEPMRAELGAGGQSDAAVVERALNADLPHCVVVDPGVFISALIGKRGSAPDLLLRTFADDRI